MSSRRLTLNFSRVVDVNVGTIERLYAHVVVFGMGRIEMHSLEDLGHTVRRPTQGELVVSVGKMRRVCICVRQNNVVGYIVYRRLRCFWGLLAFAVFLFATFQTISAAALVKCRAQRKHGWAALLAGLAILTLTSCLCGFVWELAKNVEEA